MLSWKDLEFVHKQLRDRNILALSIRDVASLAGIERALSELNVTDNDVLVATSFVALIPSADPADVRSHSGDHVANIFTELQKHALPKAGSQFIPVTGLELIDVTYLAASTDVEELSYAAQAYLAGKVAAADANDKKHLEDPLKTASSKFHSIFDRLNADLASVPPDVAAPQEAILMIAFSIDVGGSTEGKSRMLAIARDNHTRHEAYKAFYKSFLFHEDRFYKSLFRVGYYGPPPHAGPLDWRRLFIVKGIGDEIWGLYSVPRDNEALLKQTTERLMTASLELVDAWVHWGSGELDDKGQHAPHDREKQRLDMMLHPFKVYIDLIEDGFEISNDRLQFFQKCVGTYLNLPVGAQINSDFIDLMNRLNTGLSFATGSKLVQSWRTDYIGHEIDRFFRTSKGALARTVTMGEALFNRVRYVTKLTAHPGLFRAEWDNSRNQIEMPIAPDTKLYVQEDLPETDLKGIGYSYRVLHFITFGSIGKFHVGKQPNDHLYEKTAAMFPESMLTDLQSLEHREQRAAAKKPPPVAKP